MDEIHYDDFAKVEIRIGTILTAERIPDTDKLLKCSVDLGELGVRTIVSGIAQWKKPEDLVGRQCPYIVNLASRTLRGVESKGMLLAASDGDGVALLHPERALPPGTSLRSRGSGKAWYTGAMQLARSRSFWVSEWTQRISRSLSVAFPPPSVLLPRAAGIDISDSSIKWLALEHVKGAKKVATYGEHALEEGVVVSGMVQDVERLAEALKEVKKELGGITSAHAALPEELAYVFAMNVPTGTSREQILRMIEFEFEDRVPIPPSAAVYDYRNLSWDDSPSGEIGVVVFPREVAQAYVDAFTEAGITLLSLEIEARSIARAVSSWGPREPITLLVDFGRARTGFAVLKHGVPIFTSTVGVGGDTMTEALTKNLSLSKEEVETFKNDYGLFSQGVKEKKALELVSGTASALADEIARHYHYWDTRRNERGERVTPVGKVLLVGGSANLKGLPDYIAARIQAPAERGDVWRNVVSYDTYIPPIDRRRSLQYATAIGLALRGL